MADLADLCAQSRARLAAAGRALHDEIGPLLAAAGLFLSAEQPTEAMAALEQAMERVRALSEQLNPTPVDRMGLKNALLRLPEDIPGIEVSYKATARIPREAAALLYEMTLSALSAGADAGAKRLRVQVTGTKGVTVRVIDDGKPSGRARALRVPIALAEASGLRVTLTAGRSATRRSTIVSIAHADRRSSS